MAFEQVISRAPPGAGAIDAQYATVWRIGAVYWEPLEEPHCVDCRLAGAVWEAGLVWSRRGFQIFWSC